MSEVQEPSNTIIKVVPKLANKSRNRELVSLKQQKKEKGNAKVVKK